MSRGGPQFDREQVLAACAKLPGAELSHPFGADTAVFKVGGRMFALVSLADAPGRVTVKCHPAYAAALVEQHAVITPGYHMDHRHWVTVALQQALPAGLLEELIDESYHLVVAGLPARARPA